MRSNQAPARISRQDQRSFGTMAFPLSLNAGRFGTRLSGLASCAYGRNGQACLFNLCAFTVVASVLLGGGTRGGYLSDSILELCAIPTFLIALSSLLARSYARNNNHFDWGIILCLAVAILPIIQLVPLPPSIWTSLPQREQIVATFNLMGRELPWLPISVSPSSTWVSVLSLLAPLAIFFSVIQMSYHERRSMNLNLHRPRHCFGIRWNH